MTTKRPVEVQSSHSQEKAATDKNYPDAFATKQLFINSSLSMSWQMAVAVLVPVVGGYYLDQHFKLANWFIFGWFIIAVALVVAIVRRTIRQLPEFTKSKSSNK
jgi:F0F1-type ATP synthase assembly protein I